ncbi:ABC transporter substrate-binding protein [Aeromonas sp. YN13HZO-058]|uniref:substrate-binding periplasmic protein n=1 Tax=Aeromonas sp. YN13HZO-058 TaxID=1921564 RepID=UPI000946E7AA|nr:transporter substrate-binding domain-containing protein [Aeromonas sp. YN13HZO-058]OLF21802.1 ABC transporter substrate-binding protein [Aeromonas sp. YN13HZO-058]
MRVSLGSAILWGLLMWQSALAAPAPELKMAYFDDFAPYSWRDEQGKMRGLMIDVMDRVAGQMGLRVRHEGYPWQRAQKMVLMAQADGFVTVATLERRTYTLMVDEPVTSTIMTIFTQLGHPRMAEFQRARGLGDLKTFTFLDYLGNGWGKENLAGFTVHHTINVDNVFKMLAAGRGDLMVTDPLVARFKLNQLGLSGLVVEVPLRLASTPFNLCIGKHSRFNTRITEFNRALQQLRQSGELAWIEARYR